MNLYLYVELLHDVFNFYNYTELIIFLFLISIIHPDYDFKYVLLNFDVTSLIYIFIFSMYSDPEHPLDEPLIFYVLNNNIKNI